MKALNLHRQHRMPDGDSGAHSVGASTNDFRKAFSASHSILGDEIDFKLPAELEASEPPEARGLSRDAVKLMVSYAETDRIIHTKFRNISDFLFAGDVVVINTSGTMNAAVPATRCDGSELEMHFSTRMPDGHWIAEFRKLSGSQTVPFYEINAGEIFSLPGGLRVLVHLPYGASGRESNLAKSGIATRKGSRLWRVSVQFPENSGELTIPEYLSRHGFPIRYGYVKDSWPIEYYQTVYRTESGSAEMPSAGRAFTPELITGLVANGVQIAPLILHTGVASQEAHEPPYEEYYRVPENTARIINSAKSTGNRIIAIGTTVIRALETVVDDRGVISAGEGWTSEIITPGRKISSVNGLLTGMHEPQASHLAMLSAIAGARHVKLAYNAALQNRYLWHEFGDLHLIMA